MADFDLFADQLLEEAKRFLEKASESSDRGARAANLHAALMLSFCALEAHVNIITQDFSERREFSPHERGFLLERDVRLENGEFKVQESLRMTKLEERIELLHRTFSVPIDKSQDWWNQLSAATHLRNELTHAKKVPPVTEEAVRNAVRGVLGAIDALCKAIYRRKFPSAEIGLASRLQF